MPLYRLDISRWSIERIMYAFGGTLIAVFSLLALFVHRDFAWAAGFVGIMFINFALTGYCPGAIIADMLIKKIRH